LTAVAVALEELGDEVWKQVALGSFSFGVHGAGSVVVSENHPELLRSRVFIAASRAVYNLAVRDSRVLMIWFVDQPLIQECLVVVTASGHGDVGHRSDAPSPRTA
jgi:hypothetical protein